MTTENRNENKNFKNYFLPDSLDEMGDHARLRVNFIAQTLGDAIAFSEDMPVRILDISQLIKLPEIINKLAEDKFISKQYQETTYGDSTSLSKKIKNVFGKNKLNVFSEQFTSRTQTYLEVIRKLIEDLLENDEYENIATAFCVDQLNHLEDQITEKIAQKKDSELDELIELLKKPEIQLLEFLVPHLEHRIWRIQPSYDTPFVLLMRRGMFWRLYELFWLYEHFKKNVPNRRDSPITSAFGIPHVRIDTFLIGDSKNLLCMLGPTFEPIDINNSYVFFCKRGLYLKHSFNAFIQLKPEQSADHPGIEELNGALLTRSFLPIEERNRHIETIQAAWNLLLSASCEYDVASMSQGDIAALGIYACFISRYSKNRLKQLFENDLNSFCLGTDPHSINGRNRLSPWYLIHTSDLENYQLTICQKKPEDKQLIDVNAGRGAEEYGERLWCNDQARELFKRGKIPQRYYQYTERATLRSRKYISKCISALSEWFQRHFSTIDITNHEESLLGEIGHRTCRLLCELTRADMGATLYHLANDKSNEYRLMIAGDYSDDPQLSDTRVERQKAIDADWNNLDAPAVLCRKSVVENDFVYEPDFDPDIAVLRPYPKPLKPHSVLIMPLYMENRVIGLIEVKGTQKSQFLWSQRQTLHQVASVLSPYFYRQNLLESLSNISRWVFNAGPFALRSDYFGLPKKDKEAWPLNVLARGFSNIFLCRAAQIWLVDKSEQDRFILSGASDPSLIEKIRQDEGGETAITLSEGDRNILQPFCDELWDKNSGKVFAKHPFDFKVVLYTPESMPKDQDTLGIFKHFFETCRFKEMMVFMLTLHTSELQETGRSKHPVIGFVTLFHDHDSGFSANWRYTIRLVNEQTSMHLEQLDYMLSEDRMFFRITQHEFKQEANTFTNKIDSFIRQANYQNITLTKILQAYQKLQAVQDAVSKQVGEKTEIAHEFDNLLSTLGSQLSEGVDSVMQQQQALTEAGEAYEKLNYKIDSISSNKLDIFLGLDPTVSPVDCNLRSMFNDVYVTRRSELRSKGISFDNNVPSDFSWKVRREPLRRIFQNLMDNVVKYALANSTFSAGLLAEKSFYVQNEAAYDPTIKAPFNAGIRGKKAMDKPGEGIGLHVVKLCANLIGCECRFTQKNVGEEKAKITIEIIKQPEHK